MDASIVGVMLDSIQNKDLSGQEQDFPALAQLPLCARQAVRVYVPSSVHEVKMTQFSDASCLHP